MVADTRIHAHTCALTKFKVGQNAGYFLISEMISKDKGHEIVHNRTSSIHKTIA